MRIFLALMLLLLSKMAMSEALPNLVCQEIMSDTVFVSSWIIKKNVKDKTLYKFIDGKLFLSSPAHAEYFYNKVTELRDGRYSSGFKIIVFSGKNFTSATVSHHDKSSIIVSKLQCTKI